MSFTSHPIVHSLPPILFLALILGFKNLQREPYLSALLPVASICAIMALLLYRAAKARLRYSHEHQDLQEDTDQIYFNPNLSPGEKIMVMEQRTGCGTVLVALGYFIISLLLVGLWWLGKHPSSRGQLSLSQSSSQRRSIAGAATAPAGDSAVAITAFKALESAIPIALKWKTDSALLEATAEIWAESDEAAVLAHRVDPAPQVPSSAVGVDPTAAPPIISGWRFVFKSANEALSVHTSLKKLRSELVGTSADVGSIPLAGWRIDSDQAATIAIKAGATRRVAQFRIRMWDVNGQMVPLWTLPYVMKEGRLFVVRGDTGQLLTRTDPEDPTKFAPYEGARK